MISIQLTAFLGCVVGGFTTFYGPMAATAILWVIDNMYLPDYTDAEEMKAKHSGLPHGGFVIRGGKTGWNEETKHVIEYRLQLESNPEFTTAVLVAFARAAYRLAKEGQTGCRTVFDIAPALLSPLSGEEIRAHLL